MKKLASIVGRLSLLSPVLVIAVIVAFVRFVDLRPEITPDFFFSSQSAVFQQNKQITDVFPSRHQIILNVTTGGKIDEPAFIDTIDAVTRRLQKLDGISDVQSITNGPDDLKAARENPLWRRLLIGDDEKSSFVIAFLNTDRFAGLVEEIEQIADQEATSTFRIRISGLPYIVEQMRRNLTSDMKVFTLGAILLSSLLLIAVFRSGLVVLGALLACATAAMLTLVVQSLLGISIGILTANLGTIVFVLTLSHVIFLVSNWCNSARRNADVKLRHTLSQTLPASFWAAVTTLIGFASLIFVEAKPLNELGIGGTIGAVSALLCAYTILPGFLKLSKVSPDAFTYSLASRFPVSKPVARGLAVAALGLGLAIGVTGISRLNTDPSLLSYFDEKSQLYDGIYYVDQNGGSSPLLLVVRREDGAKLDGNESYERLWDLQNSLAAHPSVGSVISLPVIMAEGDEHWLGQLLPWNLLLDILSKPEYGAVAKSFISPDRMHALFMLRMKEGGREQSRLKVIEEISKIPRQHDFTITLTGGTYFLQGELAASVARSMASGIITLVLIFGVVVFIIARRLVVVAGVMACMAALAGIVLGVLGVAGIPVDIISSPAINICLGLAVDNMIHLSLAARRAAKGDAQLSLSQWEVWRKALDSQSWPATVSSLTIIIGFSVFAFSDFPPSQRFGLEVAFGTLIAVTLALAVLPYLVTRVKSSRA
ncbi:efflux RND transporter permease subunit [Kordiimonas lacus]|uniref:Predicted exporter protein, RND superfamily n=1 Tax=Kordiimonas lacus TaxID=637679 RepID=A0A1G6Y8X1_9PROT|nr:MMPL family transporter [Kordiimonas lacus]SDD86944.1 Predicted exporter protein, RND superfamily [Kordiimonas lacus]